MPKESERIVCEWAETKFGKSHFGNNKHLFIIVIITLISNKNIFRYKIF